MFKKLDKWLVKRERAENKKLHPFLQERKIDNRRWANKISK